MEGRLARVDRILRRRERYEIGIVVAGGVIPPLLGIWFIGVPASDFAFAAASLPFLVFLVLFLRSGLGTSRKRVMTLLRSLGPRLKEVEVPRRRPLHIVFDNGLVLRPMGIVALAFLFFGMDGVVIVPSVDQAIRWTKSPWRLRRVGVVAPGQGPQEARQELKRLRARLGLRVVGVGFQERRPTDLAADAGGPRWIASTSMSRLRGLHRTPSLDVELDQIVAFIRRVGETYFRYPMPTR